MLVALLAASCGSRAPAGPVARPAATPAWCLPVAIRQGAAVSVGLACVPTAALCKKVRAAALRWGALGGLGPVGDCWGPT